MIVAAVLAAVLSFRVVPLACTASGLAVAGGGVLRISPQASCAYVVPGRAIGVTLDDDSRVVPVPLAPDARPASELPKAAFAFAPSATTVSEGATVTVTIVVTIPPSTPPGSDIFLSTERSSFSPAEVRMDQVDTRRFRLQLPLHQGQRLAFRVTRGTATTVERDFKGRLPPPHVIEGAAGATFGVTVDAWADQT